MLVKEVTSVSLLFEVAMNLEDIVELYRISEQTDRSMGDAMFDVIKRGMVELKAGWPEGDT